MSKNTCTLAQQEELRENKYVKNVKSKAITYILMSLNIIVYNK